MTSGKIKIKSNGKRELKINGKELSIPREFDFSSFEPNTYDCEVETKDGKILNISIAGREVPKSDIEVQRKAEQAKKKELEAVAQKEVESRKRAENQVRDSNETQDSFSLLHSRVPLDTKGLNISATQVENFSLKLNQFARFEEKENKRGELDRKFIFFKGKKIQIGHNFGKLFHKDEAQLANRQKAAAKSLFPGDGHLTAQKFKPDWRFVTGLGGHSVYETGLTLHHVYGIPYIPASSVKGVLRSWVIFSVFGKNEQGEEDIKNAEKRALACPDFCHVFGCPNESVLGKAHQGKVTFFDALPAGPPKIEPDIMNSHYPKWYGGTGAPVDTDSPNPVFFLTVVDTPFEFLIGSKKWNLHTETFWGKTLAEWLSDALYEHGIGAKTAVGYGYFKPT